MQRTTAKVSSKATRYPQTRVPAELSTRNYQTICLMIGLLVAFCVGCGRSVRAQENMGWQTVREAAQLQQEGKYDLAVAKATEAAKLAPDSFQVQQAAAETLYLSGEPALSLAPFDRAIELAPEAAARNWQRGIALATCGNFEDGAKQFETHHRVNPDDVENSAWYFLCIAKTKGIEAARKTVIPSRGDRREPMMSILLMLKNEVKPESVSKAAIDNTTEGIDRQQAEFYADLYVGLYYDSIGDEEEAARFLKRSLTYGWGGYMVDTARVYFDARFDKPKKDDQK